MSSDKLLIAGFTVVAIIMSSTVHEWSHAMVATRLGDETPRSQGRLTIDPTHHIELFGTIILPLLGSLLGGWLIGWAKPVQFQPHRFRRDVNMRRGVIAVAAAGPLSNLILIFLCIGLLKILTLTVPFATIQNTPLLAGGGSFIAFMIYINTVLAVFNLMPIPPLDGFHILTNTMHEESKIVAFMREYQLVFFFLAIFVIFRFIIGPAFSLIVFVMTKVHVSDLFFSLLPF